MPEVDRSGESMAGSRRRVPRIAVLAPDAATDLLDGFPGRFSVRVTSRIGELESLLISSPVDLLVLDCRERMPEAEVQDLMRRETLVDFLAVGKPEDRRTLPSWLQAHWCPWPVDRRSFYRLIMAMARMARLERAFRRQKGRLRDLEQESELGARAAQVLHEVGNPLDAVRRFVRLARERSEGESADMLDNALLGLDRMAEALHGLHRHARQQGVGLDLLDLREVLREATVLSGVLDEGMEVSTELKGGPFRVPRALGPVLVNLLLNARQACGSQGRITIAAEPSGRGLEIRVTDDGEGFGELFKDELFKPWFSTREDEGGHGLGLPTARETVETLGGRLEGFSPGVNRGATFVVRLPIFAGEGTRNVGTG